ncbi:FAD-binding domain-containing protein [Deinococcus sp.]|uniref:FAD-binding domain-containing protein n=1 Tax=Deinococcus sp. TaxID=47478 RepID=UPI0025DC29EB|nr:FAD-binding domain-containing protein [Deinococcus sp.]
MSAPTDLPTRIPTDLTDEQLPEVLGRSLAGLYSGEARLPARPGGRNAALKALGAFTGKDYGARNHLLSPVSRLSMYLRHGMISPLEVAQVVRAGSRRSDREEFLRQLAWREFFWLVLRQRGAAVLSNLEEPKYRAQWSPDLPADVREARTGLPCADAWVTHLTEDGYMHNHERMWFAAYLIHWRKVDWRAGYAFFREHLLDGDLASNALSWQWVASTFSGKPYMMNQENIAKYSAGKWCDGCTAQCPFKGSYEQLQEKLFGWKA